MTTNTANQTVADANNSTANQTFVRSNAKFSGETTTFTAFVSTSSRIIKSYSGDDVSVTFCTATKSDGSVVDFNLTESQIDSFQFDSSVAMVITLRKRIANKTWYLTGEAKVTDVVDGYAMVSCKPANPGDMRMYNSYADNNAQLSAKVDVLKSLFTSNIDPELAALIAKSL